MNKQEKIEAGIAQLLFDWLDCKDMYCIDNDDAARRILSYLDKEGAVLKVKKEFPENPYHYEDECSLYTGYTRARQDMLKWHNDSLERLVEDGH